MRFNCTCPADYTGQRCDKIKHPRNCKDLATNGAKISGMHFLYDSQNNLFPVHCDFVSEAGYVWTLIQSFSLANNDQFKDYRFGVDHPVNEDGGMVNWDTYRLSLFRMQSIADASTHLEPLATSRIMVSCTQTTHAQSWKGTICLDIGKRSVAHMNI